MKGFYSSNMLAECYLMYLYEPVYTLTRLAPTHSIDGMKPLADRSRLIIAMSTPWSDLRYMEASFINKLNHVYDDSATLPIESLMPLS